MAQAYLPVRPSLPYLPPDDGGIPLVEAHGGCMPVGLGAKGDQIYITLRYDYAENCECSSDTWYIENEWCPDADVMDYCHSPMSYEMTAGPGSPTSLGPYHTARCPTTQYRLECRQWTSGSTENTIQMYTSADPIKPTYWIDRLSKPWWLTDLVVDTNGIFLLMREPFGYYLFHIDPVSYAVLNEKNIFAHDFAIEYGLTGGKPVSIAGNGTTLYILYAMEGWSYLPNFFKMVVFDVASWDATDAIQMEDTEYDGETIYRIGGDGTNGYIYSMLYNGMEHSADSEELILQKRHASVGQKFAVESSLNLTQTYFTGGDWAWNPCSDQDPYGYFRIWCFGGDSDRLFGAGVDCVDGDTQPVFYEFDTDTLEYVGKSDICKTIDPVQIVSFW